MSNLCRLSTVASVFGSVCSNIYIPAQNHCSYVTPENSRRETSTFRSISWTRSIKRFLRASIQTKCDSRSIARFYRQKLHQLGCCTRCARCARCGFRTAWGCFLAMVTSYLHGADILIVRCCHCDQANIGPENLGWTIKLYRNHQNHSLDLRIHGSAGWTSTQKTHPETQLSDCFSWCTLYSSCRFRLSTKGFMVLLWSRPKKIPERSDFIVTSPKIVQPWNLLVSKVSHSCAILVTGF